MHRLPGMIKIKIIVLIMKIILNNAGNNYFKNFFKNKGVHWNERKL